MKHEAENDQLHAMRHSLAHIMAASIQQLWPEAKFGVGPVIDNGFYYDVDLGDYSLTPDDLPRVEAAMSEIIKADVPFEQFDLGIDEAIKKVEQEGQTYKVELLNDLKQHGTTSAKDTDSEALGADPKQAVSRVSFYRSGQFEDLCRGPHVTSTAQAGAFRLHKLAGAYWRGDEKKPMLQRIYGAAFATQEELDEYFERLEEAEKRDHRKLGEELQLFFMSESVGAGLPLLMPKGETIKNLLMKYMRAKEEANGYQYVSTPVLAQQHLYERSGHASYYLENMYGTKPDEEGNVFYLKPMNCPHHHMIYEKLVQSYRDLPLRLSENAGLYRYELSGTLTGLIRMRGPITQNDSHIYVTPDQVEAEFSNVLQLFEEVYAETGVKDYWFRLSLPDFSKEKYTGDREKWEWAGGVIRKCLQNTKAKFVEELDEAAFYGPKIDIQTCNVLGKEDSIATVQLDIVVPKRMDLTYVDADGNKQFALVIHTAIMGAFERFMAFLLEQTAGHLPFWLAPEQVRIVTVNDAVNDYVKQILQQLGSVVLDKPVKYNELRFTADKRNESLGKKIREAELQKIPVILIVGPKDAQAGEVSVRTKAGEQKVKLDELGEFLISQS